jgi:hypothetical protein
MNGIDLANQYRSSYECHLVTNRSWLSILYWIIDHAIINAHILHRMTSEKPLNHAQFRTELYLQLFNFSCSLPPQRSNPDLNHCRISIPHRLACAWCSYKRKRDGQRKGRTPRSSRGCSACNNIPLCIKGQCWAEFHELAGT